MTPTLLTFLTIGAAGFTVIAIIGLLSAFGGGHGDSSDHDAGMAHAVSIFSPKIIAIFFTVFGAAGFVSTYYGLSVVPSSLIAALAGIGVDSVAVAGLRLLYRQQASSEVTISSTVGQVGTVTVEIPDGGVGEFGLTVNGQYLVYAARAKTGSLARGSQARVLGSSGSIVTVTSA